MKRFTKRLTALALAAVMALGLAACGGDNAGSGGAQKLSGTIYVPQFLDCKLPMDYINGGCAAGGMLYLTGTSSDRQEVTETDENGEEYTYYSYTDEYVLCRVNLDDGTVETLSAYTPPEASSPDGDRGGYVQNIRAVSDGTLWLQETEWAYVYDLPADFDPETDDKWNYMADYQETDYLRHLNPDGSEIESIDFAELTERLDVGYINNYLFDGDGNLYVLGNNNVIICLDGERKEVFRLEADPDPEDGSSYTYWESPILLGDGRVGMLVYSYAEAASPDERASYGYTMRAVDAQAQDWAEDAYPLNGNTSQVFTGGGDYLFYYQNNDTIYGYKAGTAEGERILSWIDANINRNNLEFFDFLADGRVCAITRDWESEENKIELALLTATDASTLPEKTTLTYATMWLSYDLRRQIIDFNKTSDKYRIEVKDYSEFNTQDDYNAGLTKLNTEIMAGTVPDILDTDGLPYQRFGQRGYLEDLWPYIENDPDLGREGVMEHVLDASSQDGKLYHVFNSFSIKTVAGVKNAVGDRTSWTLADMQAALAAMPEGCYLFGQGYTKTDMLNEVLSMNLNSFVDWSTGKCSFDDGNFKALLEFCNTFPDVYDWEAAEAELASSSMAPMYYDESVYMMEGKQLLQISYIYNLGRVTSQRTLFENGGGVSYVGYPMEDGSCGSSFRISGSSMAISSTCADKEGAWSFVRTLLLPQEETSGRGYWGSLFVNRSDFEKMVQDAMTPNEEFETDENGDPILGPDGQPLRYPKDWYWISDEEEIKVYESTQADYDQLMALYNAVDTFDNRDENIYEIVADDAAAYFAGDKDLDTVVSQIQSRVYLYVNEQM